VWAYTYFPSFDGPSHLHNADVLRRYSLPDFPAFREYYTLHQGLFPNWLTQTLLAGLVGIVPPLVAEKLVLTGYVLLLPISARYALRALGPSAGVVGFLSFPFIYNYFMHMGLYNFGYSIGLFLIAAGYWLRSPARLGYRRTLTLAGLLVLLYFAHVISLVAACLLMCLLAACEDVAGMRQALMASRTRRLWILDFAPRRLLWLGAAMTPSLALTLAFMVRQRSQGSLTLNAYRWYNLVRLNILKSFDRSELVPAIALAIAFGVVLVGLLVTMGTRARRRDALLYAAIMFVCVYILAPDAMSGGSVLAPRLMVFPYLGLMLWFGSRNLGRLARAGIPICGSVIAVSMVVLYMGRYAEMEELLAEYTSGASLVEPNTTLLPVTFLHFGTDVNGEPLSSRVPPFTRAAGYIAAERHAVDLANYEADTGYFPTRWRPRLNPFRRLGVYAKLPPKPPDLDIPAYREAGGRIDYVLMWGMQPAHRTHPGVAALLQQLADDYDLIHTSSPRGLMQMYGRRGR